MVCPNMFVQVAFLRKSQQTIITVSKRTCVGSLLGVNPQVVKEIVPLAEAHLTAWEFTLHDAQQSQSPWIFVLIYSKLPGTGNEVLLLDLILLTDALVKLHLNIVP